MISHPLFADARAEQAKKVRDIEALFLLAFGPEDMTSFDAMIEEVETAKASDALSEADILCELLVQAERK